MYAHHCPPLLNGNPAGRIESDCRMPISSEDAATECNVGAGCAYNPLVDENDAPIGALLYGGRDE